MRVLVTRAFHDAQRTAQELVRRGHEAIVAPLSEVRLLATAEPDLDDVQAILATSSNGIRAMAARCPRRDITVFAVGANTAATARSAGFAHVLSADGDSMALAATVQKRLSPAAGVLLHVTGKRSTKRLRRLLADAGFTYRAWELYDITARNELPESVAADLRRGAIAAVLVLSPGSGRDLAKLLSVAGVGERCRQIVACCISKAAAAALEAVEFGDIRVAGKPNLESVLALLDAPPAPPHRTGLARRKRA